ncbi:MULTISPECIES: hypothetical protein [unclassified Pseudoalteromonas]|uniref:hypothetical protein n=1 Tax=unclassified Pseudoalteromonas TaxID=194690 RepID=UPI000F64E623|nr:MULTISPECIES: hypothetical protein [unclassified Pseudoalteromonas]RRS07258.1 hypothetical protein EAG18_17985 [Pseudoalteromonas sp. J010]RXF02831.1 hypothetical protein D9603_09810 [Pseudoalteromonas sp. PS5]
MAIVVSSTRLIPVLRRVVAAKKFAQLHPSLIPFLLYLAISGIGLYYLACLLNAFGFSALKHIGISDFLTVIMTNFLFVPALLLVSLSLLTLIKQDKKLVAIRFLGLGKLSYIVNQPLYKFPVLSVSISTLVLSAYAADFAASSAVKEVKSLQQGNVDVYLSYPIDWFGQSVMTIPSAVILLSTSRYTFIYHPETKKAVAIPDANLGSIVKMTRLEHSHEKSR